MIPEDLEADAVWLLAILTDDLNRPPIGRRPELTEAEVCERLWERDYPEAAAIYPVRSTMRFGAATHRQAYARALIAALVLAEDAEQISHWFSRLGGEIPAWRATSKAFKAAKDRAFMQADYSALETRALAALIADPNFPPGVLAVQKNRDPHETTRLIVGIDLAFPEKEDE